MAKKLEVASSMLLDDTEKRSYFLVIFLVIGMAVGCFIVIQSVMGLEKAIYGLLWPFVPEELYKQGATLTAYTGIMKAFSIVLICFLVLLRQSLKDERYLTLDQMKAFHALIQRLGVSAKLPEVKDAIETIDRSGRMPVYYELRSLRAYVKHRDKTVKKLQHKPWNQPDVSQEYRQTWQSIISDTAG